MSKSDLIERLSDLILAVDYSDLVERDEIVNDLNGVFERLTGNQMHAIPLF